MRTTLQYIYTIGVFAGVLFTAYLMMNRETTVNYTARGMQSPAIRAEGGMVDPAVSSLIEMEDALGHMKRERAEEHRRPNSIPLRFYPRPASR